MTIRIPEDWDELSDWILNDFDGARDAIINLQREAREARTIMRNMLAEMIWMTGSQDFGPGGKAEEGFDRGVRPVMQEAEKFLGPP